MERKLRVFLCHASQDKPIVRDLYQRLLAEYWIDPWLDEEKLLPGHDWREVEIPKAVRNSDVVLVALSKNAVNKDGYIQKEIKMALDAAEEKPEGTIFIIPIRIDDCDVPQRLTRYHWVNYFEPDSYRQIIKSLQTRAFALNVNIIFAIDLSNREKEILFWIAKGLANKEIASHLGTSYQTVKNQVNSLYGKLGVRNRAEAVAFAFEHGLV